MLYLDDRLPGHPKILKAGQRLGPDGAAKALYLYVWGLAYSRQHLTDGFISSTVLASCGAISGSGSIAKVLANRTIRLWRKVKGGYQIHDFHVYNPKASEEKEKRELNRQRMAQWRAAKAKARNAICNSTTRLFVRELSTSTSTSTSTKSTSTGPAVRLAFARRENARPETPTFALACVVMGEAIGRSRWLDGDTTAGNVGEHFKQLCAQRGLAYDSDLVRRAYDAVTTADRRRA